MRIAKTFLFLIAAGTVAAGAETIDANRTENDFVSSEDIEIRAGTFKLTGNSSISHNVSIDAGTLANTGALDFSGTLTSADNTVFNFENADFSAGTINVITASFNFAGTQNKIGNASGDFDISLAAAGTLSLESNFSGTLKSLKLEKFSTVKIAGGNIDFGDSGFSVGSLTYFNEIPVLDFSGTVNFVSDLEFGESDYVTITFSDNAKLSGTGKLKAVSVEISGNVVFENNVELETMVATDNAALNIAGTLTVSKAFAAVNGKTLTISGAGTLEGTAGTNGDLLIFSPAEESGGANFVIGISTAGKNIEIDQGASVCFSGDNEAAELDLGGTVGTAGTLTVDDFYLLKNAKISEGTLKVNNDFKHNWSGRVLELAAGTVLEAPSIELSGATAEIKGVGTLKGDLTFKNGILGVPEVIGNVVSSGKYTKVSAQNLNVTGTWTNVSGGILCFENNVQTVSIAGGMLENSGTLTIEGETTFTSGILNKSGGTLQINAGASLPGTNVVFEDDSILKIDISQLAAGTPFDAVDLDEHSLDNVQCLTVSGISLDDRLVWRNGAYVFLGLNGRVVKTTLYPDFLREQSLQAFSFNESVLNQYDACAIRKPLFGKNRNVSRYMRGYLERSRQFDRDENKAEIVPVEEENPGDFAKAVENALARAWIAGTSLTTSRRASGTFQKYDFNASGVILGTDMFISENWKTGAAFGFSDQKMKSAGTENFHKIETESWQGAAFLRYDDRTGTDATFSLFGSKSGSDSERGNASGNFDAWQAGVSADFGLGFMPDPESLWRTHFGIATVYTSSDAFDESGAGTLSLEKSHAWASRLSAGMSYAWLPADAFQITISGRGFYDFGSRSFGIGAYDNDTNSDVRLVGRNHERFGLQANIFGDWALDKHFSLFGGFTGTHRSNSDEIKFTLGARAAF